MLSRNKKNRQFIILAFFLFGYLVPANTQPPLTYQYEPPDLALYDTITKLDSMFFDAYNTCTINLDRYASFYSDSLEFYHDQGGFMNSKTDIVEATKRNICGKVTRELLKGSIEVYPINNYGAVEMGLHIFHNNQEPPPEHPKIGRFIIIWKHESDGWKIAKVISLH